MKRESFIRDVDFSAVPFVQKRSGGFLKGALQSIRAPPFSVTLVTMTRFTGFPPFIAG